MIQKGQENMSTWMTKSSAMLVSKCADLTAHSSQRGHSTGAPRTRPLAVSVLLSVGIGLFMGCGDNSTGDSGLIELPPMDSGMMSDMMSGDVEDRDMAVPSPDAQMGAFVEATFRIINPAAGQGFSGVTVTGPQNEGVTDVSGVATVSVPSGPYRVSLDVAGARTHEVWGVAGNTAFQQITYLSTDMITGFVFGSLGLSDDLDKGILVVGLDTPSLAPAVGAEANISAESDAPFIFAGVQPTAGQTIPAGGQGFVTFPNVAPGPVTIETIYPNGDCLVFPAETDLTEVDIIAGQVTVIAFTCRTSE